MLSKLFGSKKPVRIAGAPAGQVVYAVGDIHGRADLLDPLIDKVLADARESGAARKVLIFLGDYVDRGPGSAAVIDRLIELSASGEIECRFLAGNHEETLLQFLSDPSVGPTWGEFGGRATLLSYGIVAPTTRTKVDAWAEASHAFGQALPEAHRRFFEALEDSAEIGDYFFCHAGARPGVPLHLQSRQDLMWIREEFLDDRRRFEKVVVHGHTPHEAVHSDERRIGIDTGAYATGVLTAVRLSGDTRRFIQS